MRARGNTRFWPRTGRLTCPGLCYDAHVSNPEEHYWEFIPGLESSDAYAAFEDFRDQDPRHRTLASAARRSGVAYPTIQRWARENFWHDRCESYDAMRAATRATERRKLETEADQAWAEQRAELLAKLREAALHGLDQLVHDLTNRRTRLRPNELKQITDVLLKYGNLANGDVTERVDNVIDLSNASEEDLAALERLRQFEKSGHDDGE